jgi:hypothetical protein
MFELMLVKMRNVKTLLVLIICPAFLFSQQGREQVLKNTNGSPLITGIYISLPYGDISNKLPVEKDTLFIGASISPGEAYGYKLKWSVDVGLDVIQVLNDSTGAFKALKPGFARVKCLALDGSDVFSTKDITVVDTPQVKSSFNMTFTSATTDAWIGEGAADSIPIYTTTIDGGYLKLVIDKAGPLDSLTKWPLATYKTFSTGFSCLRLSMCPVNGILLDLSKRPIVTIKLRTTNDCRFELGYASKYSPGNAATVIRNIKASPNFSLVSFYFAELSWKEVGGKYQMIVDSSKVSHFFLNFNPGPLNTKAIQTAAGPDSYHKQPYDFKGTVEMQYIKFGDVAELIQMNHLTIRQSGIDKNSRPILFDLDTSVRLKTFPLYGTICEPTGNTIPYVDWTVSDTSIASIKQYRIDSGLYNIGRLTPKKPGIVKIIATARDGTGIMDEKTIRVYDYFGMPSAEEIFIIYPNPIRDILNIEAAEDISFIDVYSIFGQKLKSVKNEDKSFMQIDFNGLISGIYLLEIHTRQGEKISHKIIKQ